VLNQQKGTPSDWVLWRFCSLGMTVHAMRFPYRLLHLSHGQNKKFQAGYQSIRNRNANRNVNRNAG